MTIYPAKLPAAGAWIESGTYELLARAIVVLVFTIMATLSVTGAMHAAINWTDQPLDQQILGIVARLSNALFLALIAATTVTRLRPIRKATGVQPRVSALLGTVLL